MRQVVESDPGLQFAIEYKLKEPRLHMVVVGSVHPVETLEFLWALRRIGWQKPVLLDQFPFREDPVGAATLSIQAIEGMERILDRIDVAALDDAQERQDALAAQALVLGELLGAGR